MKTKVMASMHHVQSISNHVIKPGDIIMSRSRLSSEKELSCLKINARYQVNSPLKMASVNQSPEVKSILKQIPDLTTALSNNSLGVAGMLHAQQGTD